MASPYTVRHVYAFGSSEAPGVIDSETNIAILCQQWAKR